MGKAFRGCDLDCLVFNGVFFDIIALGDVGITRWNSGTILFFSAASLDITNF